MLQRRTVLVGFAITAATPAFAQGQSGRISGSTRQSSPETDYVQQTLTLGSLSLLTSRIAQQRARSDKLKEFSQFEAAEQETVADVLRSLQNPSLVNGKITAPQDAELEKDLDQEGRNLFQKLQAEQNGSTFDPAYLQSQFEGHDKLLRIHDEYLSLGRDFDTLNIAKLARGLIKEHLRLLADLGGR